jgi:hypothetical protein
MGVSRNLVGEASRLDIPALALEWDWLIRYSADLQSKTYWAS